MKITVQGLRRCQHVEPLRHLDLFRVSPQKSQALQTQPSGSPSARASPAHTCVIWSRGSCHTLRANVLAPCVRRSSSRSARDKLRAAWTNILAVSDQKSNIRLQESAPARTRSLCGLRVFFRKPLEFRAALLQALQLLVQQRLHKKSVLSHSLVDVLANSPNPPIKIIQSHACGSSPLFGGMSLLARALRHAAAAEARCVARQGCTAPEAPALQRHVF